MINIGLHHLRLVSTITKEGTLTRAAQSLHLTQSALSHQLKELESELGTSVFERKGKKLELSNEGNRFLVSAEKILAELRSLELDIKGFKEGKKGTLRISTQCYTAYHWLPRIIKYYKEISPEIDIHINSGATYRPLDFLLTGELDVAIVRSRINNPLIHYEPIFEDQLYAILSTQNPLARKKKIAITDLQDQELFLPYNDPQSGNIPVIETLMEQQQVRPKHLHRIHYTDAIIEMVNSNLGISIMANWIIKPYVESRDIVAKPLPPEVSNRKWYAATCKKDPAINHFMDCLKLHFSEMTMKI
jgi:LysR family transcriptional regulator for metE and metH